MDKIAASLSNVDRYLDKMVDFGAEAGIRIIFAIVIYVVGRIVINWILRLYDRIGRKNNLDVTAAKYIRTIIKFLLYAALIISIIADLGVEMTSVIALITSFGVAIGLAMQGSLSNLAGGIMLLIFRPFSVGDYITACGEDGVVREISMFYTVLVTLDNRVINMPNGAVMNSNIVNSTHEEFRRLDLPFNIAREVPVKKVQATIMGAIIDCEHALADPAPIVEPLEPVTGGITYIARVWIRTDDYWDAYYELMRNITTALNTADIPGPSKPVVVTNK